MAITSIFWQDRQTNFRFSKLVADQFEKCLFLCYIILDFVRILKAFEEGSFSAVFMDIYMDSMDGVAAALKMQATEKPCRMTMAEFTDLTDSDSRFLPINKGIIVNAEYILEIEVNCCVLEDGAKFPIRICDHLKIEQAMRDYNFRKIRENQHHRKEE